MAEREHKEPLDKYSQAFISRKILTEIDASIMRIIDAEIFTDVRYRGDLIRIIRCAVETLPGRPGKCTLGIHFSRNPFKDAPDDEDEDYFTHGVKDHGTQ